MSKAEIRNKVLEAVVSHGGEAFQKELLAEGIAGKTTVRKALSALNTEGVLVKEKTKSGALLWKFVGNNEDAEEKIASKEEAEKNERAEYRTAFMKVGMTKHRAHLMAKKIQAGERTEEEILKEWETNSANPKNAKTADTPKLDALKKVNEKQKAKAAEAEEKRKKSTKRNPPNYWSHRKKTQASALDDACKWYFLVGIKPKLSDIMTVTGLGKARVLSHLRHLRDANKHTAGEFDFLK